MNAPRAFKGVLTGLAAGVAISVLPLPLNVLLALVLLGIWLARFTRRAAGEKTGDLHVGYCGTGATLLFGAHPSFTRLKARIARPDGPASPG
jgi:hypothetical protein